jgi:hypothetical protein
MGFMPTSTPVPSALNSVPAGTVYTPPPALFTVPEFYLKTGYYRSRSFSMNVPGMRQAVGYLRRLMVAANCRYDKGSPCSKIASYLRRAQQLLSRLESVSFGALALQSNPAHYGSPDADDVQRGLQGAGAAGFGIMGALIGAAVGAGIQFRGKPLKDGWLYGSMAGFLLPVILLAPKKEEAV